MRLLGQFQTSVFLRKDFARTKTQTKPKPTNFLSLRSFYAEKIVAFVVFCLLNFTLLVGFGLICVFVRFLRLLIKKNWFEIITIISSTIPLTCTPLDQPIKLLLTHNCFYL